MNQLYKERMIELFAEKKHFGKLDDKTHESAMKNPSCEDNLTIELNISNGIIEKARFHGVTCFVSTVSAEVLMGKIEGMKLEEVMKFNKEDLDNFLGIDIIDTRVGCEVFPLDVLKSVKEVLKY